MKEFKTKLSKKFFIAITLLLIAFQVVSVLSVPVTAAESEDTFVDVNLKLDINGKSPGIATRGEIFQLRAVIQNNTGSAINDVKLVI
ncbi:MAG TPA: hypothetical protein GXX37_12370, partial [Clostridiaceae bacterium]|nr:hypothetical protein [Clostridiaceae bacterium]